jgi:hypothetical protein
MKNLTYPVLLASLALLASCKEEKKMFTLLTPEETGVNFNNINVENEQINIFSYEYLYNGAGVAAGDINNDGLVDLYFTSNNLENKLFLNKGDLKFEDITEKSGTGCKAGWKTGVNMVDINGDGLLDIYVCRSADSSPERRKNSLLINNGDLTFTDKAKEYGLDNDSYSTQAAFFDYDKDGDLDAFILNHSLLQISNSFNISSSLSRERYPYVGNQLFRNDNGHFVLQTDEAGVLGPHSNYGLGISVSDLNNDGNADIYTSNDYVDSDKLYLNLGNGKFKNVADSLFTHVSQFSMGNDIADINGDGLMDIISLDMLPEDNKRQKLLFGPDRYDVQETSVRNGYQHQYMRNMLQLNNGDGTFSEIGQIAGVSNTDWSWSALFADYDNDGLQDLFISNGYKRDFTNNDFLRYKADQQLKANSGQKEKFSEMIKKMPSNKLHNYIFKNNGDLTFKDVCVDWGFTNPVLTNGSVYADLDNDGDLDLVMSNMDEQAGIYRNNAEKIARKNYLKVKLQGAGKNTGAIGARVTVFAAGKMQVREMFTARGFQSSVDPILHFGLDTLATADSVIVRWPSGKVSKINQAKANQLITAVETEASEPVAPSGMNIQLFTEEKDVDFIHHENEFVDFKTQALLPHMYSRSGPALASADVNGDGLSDLFVGGARNQSGEILVQNENGKYNTLLQKAFSADVLSEDVDAVFFDADQDGDNDLYVVSGGYEFIPEDDALRDRLYLNNGKGKFERSVDALPGIRASKSCVRPCDLDQDGDLDLFVGGRLIPGRYPETPASYIFTNDGKGKFTDATKEVAGGLDSLGMVTDACWIDINKDDKKDLVVVGEWMPVKFFVNENGKLTDKSAQYLSEASEGWWNTVTATDIDNDGDEDLALGNFGMNNQVKATADRPAKIFYADFDNNGSVDPLVSYFIQDKSYPYANRDELTDQVPMFKKRFTDYESYSNATIETLLKPEEIKKSRTLSATRFKTSILQNNDGKFVFLELPIQAQFAPVFAIASADVNQDGNIDLIIAGNLEKSRVRTGKLTGNNGFVFLGNGKGKFDYVTQLKSGLSVRGDVKHLIWDNNKLIFGVNNKKPVVYRLNQ